MNKTGYFLLYNTLWLIALLPYKVLYVLSDLLYLLIYRLLAYRKKVVRANLQRSFPEKSHGELRIIEKQFYHNLADIIVETLKLLHVSQEAIKERFTYQNREVIEALERENKTIFVAFGHCSNWEMMAHAISLEFQTPFIALYKKLSSPTFDQLMKDIRSRWGKVGLFESQSAYRQLMAIRSQPHIVYLLGDQTPPGLESDYWTDFLHQDTPFFNGLEKMGRSFGHAVVYFESERIARGRYLLNAILITGDGKKNATNEITERYVRLLEKTIQTHPDNWLWSHRRWKHQRPKTA